MTRKLLFAAVAVLLALAAGDSFAEKKEAALKTEAPFVHTVIFTMKADVPKEAESELIADCHTMLAKIPSVRALRVGRPAERSTPRFGKKDYSVGLVIFFDDADGLMAYDKHELHQKFVAKHGKNIDLDKLLVYDFSNQMK